MEGLGCALGAMDVNATEEVDEIVRGLNINKMTKKQGLKLFKIHGALLNLSEEQLDEVIADCQAGKWSKKLPGKPWYFGLLSKKRKNERYLYMHMATARIIKIQLKAYKEAAKEPRKLVKMSDIVF